MTSADSDWWLKSVDTINEYRDRHHEGRLGCLMHETKGRIIVAGQSYTCGTVIIVEPPLHVVQADPDNPAYLKVEELAQTKNFFLEPLWYWCALNSLVLTTTTTRKETDRDDSEDDHSDSAGAPSAEKSGEADDAAAGSEEVGENEEEDGGADMGPTLPNLSVTRVSKELRERLLTFFIPSTDTPSREIKILMKAMKLERYCDPLMLELLLQSWVHNCFEYTFRPLGYATYFMPSFCSHSCQPNAVWTYDSENNFVLTARTHIKEGDELTISYISEDGLQEMSAARQLTMTTTKGFTCTCPRCTASADPSRGFRCPNCIKGEIFFSPDAATKRDLRGRVLCENGGGEATGSTAPEIWERFLPNDVTVVVDSKPDCTLSGRRYIVDPEVLEKYYSAYGVGEKCLLCRKGLTRKQRRRLLLRERIFMSVVQGRLQNSEAADYGVESEPDSEDDGTDDEEDEGILSGAIAPVRACGNDLEMTESGAGDDKKSRGKEKRQKRFERLVALLEAESDENIDAVIQKTFGQHQIVVNWNTYYAGEMAKSGQGAAAMKILTCKEKMLRRMYPALAASVAWCLEEVSDIASELASSEAVKHSAETMHENRRLAIEGYKESIEMSAILFGTAHEYCADTIKKFRATGAVKDVRENRVIDQILDVGRADL